MNWLTSWNLYEEVRTKEPIGKIPIYQGRIGGGNRNCQQLKYVRERENCALVYRRIPMWMLTGENYLRELEGIGLSRYLTITQGSI